MEVSAVRYWQLSVVFAGVAVLCALAGAPQAQANPIQAPLDTIKGINQKIAEVTQLLTELDAYLSEVLAHVQEATLSEEDTALEELYAAQQVNSLFVRDLALSELRTWAEDLRDEFDSLAQMVKRLRAQGGGRASGFSRVLTRSGAKAAALQALGWDLLYALDALAAKVDLPDVDDLVCVDEFGDPPLDAPISLCLEEAIAAVREGDLSGLDARADRIETIILEHIEPEKAAIQRKLTQMKTELRSLERELKRLARLKEREELKRSHAPRTVALAAGITVRDALERIVDLQQIAKDMHVQLLDIDDQMDALLDLVAEIKSDVELGRPVMELRSLVEQALQLKDFTLLLELERVEQNLQALLEEHAQLVEQVRMLCAGERIRRRGSCRRALQDLTVLGGKLERIPPIFDSLASKLDNGRPLEGFPCTTADPCDDVNDWLLDLYEELTALPGASTEYDAERFGENLINAALLVQEAIAQKDCLLLGLTCAVESGLRPFRGLVRELTKELKLLQRLLGRELYANSAPGRPLSGLSASEALHVSSGWVHAVVYGLDGRPHGEVRPSDGRTPLEALNARARSLPNGVYIVVLTSVTADGRLRRELHKLTLVR
jgi:hypothetical protein